MAIASKYIVVCKEYILLFRLIIHGLYLFACVLSTFYLGMLFTHTVAWMSLLSIQVGADCIYIYIYVCVYIFSHTHTDTHLHV